MARTHARIYVDIWLDAKFCDRSARAQRLFLLLVSQPDLSPCGTLTYAPGRWAMLARDTKADGIAAALAELVADGYVLVDELTAEVWIRSFLRWDGVLSQPNVALAALNAAGRVFSPTIRGAIDADYGTALKDAASRAYRGGRSRTDRPSQPGSLKPSDRPRGDGVGDGDGSNRSTSSSGNGAKAPSRRRGTPVPDPWAVTDELRAWAAGHAITVDLVAETESMVDWARGKGETKRDWEASRRNWMRRAQRDQRPTRRGASVPVPPKASDKVLSYTPTVAEESALAGLSGDDRYEAIAGMLRARGHRV